MSDASNRPAGDGRSETFLARWSRRKRVEPEQRQAEDQQVAAQVRSGPADDAQSASNMPVGGSASPAVPPADLPPVDSLTPESDYTRFMKPDVPMASRNAAMKKLFTDPHFNVMDGLDIYIDDYTKPDPIPESMLRDLAQSRMLKLFNYEEDDAEDARKLAAQREAVAPVVPEQASPASIPDAAAHTIAEPAPDVTAESDLPAAMSSQHPSSD